MPQPSLVAEGVTLANASWGTQAPMVSVGRLSVEVNLWSLLVGPIRITNIELEDVDVLLEQNAAGQANWVMTADSEPETANSSGRGGLPAIIELASIRNVNVLRKRPATDDFTAVLTALDFSQDASGVAKAAGTGQVGTLPLTLDLELASAAGGATRVGIDASLGETTVRGSAIVAGQQIEFDGTVASLAPLAAAFGLSGVPPGDLQLDGTLTILADGFELTETVVKLAGVEAHVDGVISRDSETPSKFDLSVAVPNLAERRPELPTIAFTAAATASVSADKIELDPLRIELGGSDLAGSLTAELGDSVKLTARGESKLIDLTELERPAPAGIEAGPAQTAPAEPADPKKRWVFGEEALPLDLLPSYSVDVELKIAELKGSDIRAENVELALKGAGGTFELAASFADTDGGSGEGKVVLTTTNNTANLDIDVEARELRVAIVSGKLDDEVQSPRLGLAAKVRATGTSPRTLAAGATGRVLVTQGPGQIRNSAVGVFSGDIIAQLFGALNPFAKEEEFTNWECTVMGVDLTDGLGEINTAVAQTEKLLIVGKGTVDLDAEQLDIAFNTKPRSGVGITADMFVTPFVKLGGTFVEPGISMNASGALLEGGAAVLTGGMSLLLRGMSDRMTAEGDQCAEALAEAGNPVAVAD